MNRRRFLKKTAGTAAGLISFPYIVPSTVLGRPGTVAPSNKITIGCIGMGWQGEYNMVNLLNHSDTKVVAVCDIDAKHLKLGADTVNKKYGDKDCATYHDYRRLLAREDIDAVMIALPDHWHGISAIAAARAGKDIFGEKPLSHCFAEGRAICNAVKRYGVVWQTGSWQRSRNNFRFAAELVRNGRIGKVLYAEASLPAGQRDFTGVQDKQAPMTPPAGFDYDTWLGPAPYEPYCPARTHKIWRWVLDYGGGQLMDWVGHHVDIIHWGLGLDDTGPIDIEGWGVFPKTGLWNSATKFRLVANYANGIHVIIADQGSFGTYGKKGWGGNGAKWVGEDGWVKVWRSGMETYPESLMKEKFGPDEIHLTRSDDHFRNFLDCVKTRETTITPCQTAHRSQTPGHLGHIAMTLGRKIRFNPETEEIIDDPTASRMLTKPMRSPWHL